MVTKFQKQLSVVLKKVSYLVRLRPEPTKIQQLLSARLHGEDYKPPEPEPVHYSKVTIVNILFYK